MVIGLSLIIGKYPVKLFKKIIVPADEEKSFLDSDNL